MMESVNVLRKQDKYSDLPHVAAKNLVEGCRLLGIGVQVLGHLLGQQVTLLQGLHKVPANTQRSHNKTLSLFTEEQKFYRLTNIQY
jgi:hypothetical protein